MTSLFRTNYGPQPKNTLSRVVLPSQQHKGNQLGKISHGFPHRLETRISTGDNLLQDSLELGSNVVSASESERHAKRRKLELPRNSQNTPQILDGSDDEDQLMITDYASIRHVSPTSKNAKPTESKSTTSRGTSNPAPQEGAWTTGVSQYKNVEKCMNSSLPNTKKHRDRAKRKARGPSGTPGSSLASSQSDSLELLGYKVSQKPPSKPSYQGTANLHPPRPRNGNTGRSTGDRSPHFLLSSTTSQDVDLSTVTGAASNGPTSTEAQLRHLYRDTTGKRRGGADHSSSDELVTAGSNSRALSPVKTIRSQSPSKNGQASPGPSLINEESIEEQPIQSNIRPAKFTRSVKKEAHANSRAKQRNDVRENPSIWSLPLKRYYSQGHVHEDNDLKILYTESDRSYDIYHNGFNLATTNPNLRIYPSKLIKVYWSLEGTKMRFESSKMGYVDNVLDIDLCHEKDVQEFNAVLQESRSFRVKGEPRETMDRKFEHRLEEQRRANITRRHSPEKLPADVMLADIRVKRADAKRVAEEHCDERSKRRRVVDMLGDGEPADRDSRRGYIGTEPNGTSNDKLMASKNRLKEENDVDLGPLEQSLRRSLRSHNPSKTSTSRPQEAVPHMLDEKIERYSRNNNMGKAWSRPLVYPKDGKKRTTVEWDDLERLDDGEFLNDNLIAFYLRYLEHEVEKKDPTISQKVYMFNTFFYERLTSGKSASKGINYEAVSRWTRGIDLFAFDFVIVPVHEAVHWYVAIICNLPALNRKLEGVVDDLDDNVAPGSEHGSEHRIKDTAPFSPSPKREVDDIKELETTTSFAEMSLEPVEGLRNRSESKSRSPNPFNPYSTEQEALDDQLRCSSSRDLGKNDGIEDETKDAAKPVSPKLKKGRRKSVPPPRNYDPYKPTILTFDSFGTAHANTVKILKQYLHEEAKDKRGLMEFDEKELQGVTAKNIPQQLNFYDCGLYLLGYIEKMLEDPRQFIDKIMRRQFDIEKDWSTLKPGILRTKIRNLLVGLHRQRVVDSKNGRKSQLKPKKTTEYLPTSTAKEKPQPSNLDGAGGTVELPMPALEENARRLVSPDPILETLETGNEQRHEQISDVGSKPCTTAMAKEEAAVEANPTLPSPVEPPPQSFIVLDSQSQAPNIQIPIHQPESSQSIVISPTLPSTIPDSQPPIIDELPVKQDVRPASPVVSKKPRRIESFSSPPSAKKIPNSKRNSGRTTGPIITGTDPKVVISID